MPAGASAMRRWAAGCWPRDDPIEARQIAETLDRLNRNGRRWSRTMLAEARAEADAELAGGDGPAIIVTASDKWHPGIVGLIAARLKDHARRPGLRDRLQSQRRRAPVRAARFPASTSASWCARPSTTACSSRAAATRMAAGITVERSRLGELRAFFEDCARRRSCVTPARRGIAQDRRRAVGRWRDARIVR